MQKQHNQPPVGKLRFHQDCKKELRETMQEVDELLQRAYARHN